LAPGDSITGLTFSNRLLYVDTAKQLLKDSSNFYVGVASYEIADPLTGLPSNGQMTEINAKTAAILIDYDIYSGRDPERFRVATNLVEGDPGVSLKAILERYLGIPCEQGTVNGITGLKRLRTYDFSGVDHTKWVITHFFNENGEPHRITYDITQDSYDLAAIKVKAGNAVSLLYVVDKDGEGLPHRLEQAMGTSDSIVDSDPKDAYATDLAWYLAGHPAPDNPDDPTTIKYQLTYSGNGHTGGLLPEDPAPYPAGSSVPIANNPGGLAKIHVNGESYRFAGWNTEPNGSGTSYDSTKPFTMGTGNTVLYAKWEPYAIGDKGPAGGYIYIIKDYYSDGWRYLEAAPSDYPNLCEWWGWNGVGASNGSNFIDMTTLFGTGLSAAMGVGKSNTETIESKDITYATAADVCANLVIDRYSDWFLPSEEELMLMVWVQRMGQAPIGLNLNPNTAGSHRWVAYWTSSLGQHPYIGYNVELTGTSRLPSLIAIDNSGDPTYYSSLGCSASCMAVWGNTIADEGYYSVRAVRRF
jgi:uncharacterized repeat protein (TIGR02543 family)